MKIKRICLKNIAGYSSITWDKIQPDLNFLVGRNGAGKSTILQSLSLCLNFICGRRSEDLLTRTYPNAEIEIKTTSGPSSWHFVFEGKMMVGPRYLIDIILV